LWLSELEPISVQHTPMMTLGWPHARDSNVLGQPMRICGQSFDRGIGVHGQCLLTYDLAGGFQWFVTSLGIDDSVGLPALADVTAEILVDGQVRFREPHITAGRLVGPVRVDVSGAARVELRTLFGENGAVQDRFNWAGAGLIRPRGPDAQR
jgi:hypothetical protein